MTIDKTLNGNEITLSVDGRLDNNTAPEFLAAFNEAADESDDIVLDLAGVIYLSSAGLRAFASAQKTMNKKGKLTIRNVTPDVMEIFELTGFLKILSILLSVIITYRLGIINRFEPIFSSAVKSGAEGISSEFRVMKQLRAVMSGCAAVYYAAAGKTETGGVF